MSASQDHFVLTEEQVVAMFLYPGWRAEIDAGDEARARREMRAHLDRFCADGMRTLTVRGERFFDPVALNFICERGRIAHDPFWMERAIEPRRQIARSLKGGTAPTARFHDPRRVTYELRREIVFSDRAPGTRVISSLPLPVEEAGQRDIMVTPLDLSDAKVTVDRGILSVRAIVPADRRVRFGVRIDALCSQQTVQVDPAVVEPRVERSPELTPYLACDESLIRVTPAVEALAHRLARSNAWDTVLAIWEHFFDERWFGSLHYHELDPDDVLGSVGPWVDCYIGSALLIALARSNGIPARMVHGALVYPGSDMGLHYWSELFLPPYGWLPFDLHSWLLSAGNKHDDWSHFLSAHLPYQLVFFRLPRTSFQVGLQYPKRWYTTTTPDGVGQRYDVYDLDSGALAFSDYYAAKVEALV